MLVCESSLTLPDEKYCWKIRLPISSVSSSIIYWLYWRINDTRRLKSVRNSGRTIAVQLYRAANNFNNITSAVFPQIISHIFLNVNHGFHRTKNVYNFTSVSFYFELSPKVELIRSRIMRSKSITKIALTSKGLKKKKSFI